MKYGLLLLLATALVAGVWLAAPERATTAAPALAGLAPAGAFEESRTALLGPGRSAERMHLAATLAAEERSEVSHAQTPLACDLESLERERERVLEELFAGIDSAADARFRRGEFEPADLDPRTADRIQVTRRSPTGAYERVELTPEEHPELYAMQELAESLRERIEGLEPRSGE